MCINNIIILYKTQTLMNVLKTQMAVLRLAQTQLEAMSVHVTLAIAWQVTIMPAMVSCSRCPFCCILGLC